MAKYRKVYLVDDDATERRRISRCLIDSDFDVRPFPENEFIEAASELAAGCAVVDISANEAPRFEPLRCAVERREILPAIAMCDHCTIRVAVQAIRHGAVDVFEKRDPVNELILMIDDALTALPAKIEDNSVRQFNIEALLGLSRREFQVLGLVAEGHMSKNIAHVLNITPRTVEMHRGRLIRKLKVRHMGEAVHMLQHVSLESDIISRFIEYRQDNVTD